MANQFSINNGKPEEISLCYGQPGEQLRPGCIGYLRGDFGRSGSEFWSNWFRGNDELNKPAFKQEFDKLVNELRDEGLLKNRAAMQNFCSQSGSEYKNDSYHFTIETKDYMYCLRCMLNPGNYNFYIFTYQKDQMQYDQKNENLNQEESDDRFKLDL